MNTAPNNKALKHASIAIFFIALSALSTAAPGQNVFKCGNSYSQTPCPGGSSVNVDDARDAQQKKQTDEAVQRDEKQAKALESARVAQEQEALKQPPGTAQTTATRATSTPHEEQTGVVHKITPKRLRPAHHKPEEFVAQVPGSEKKSSTKKIIKKKAGQKADASQP